MVHVFGGCINSTNADIASNNLDINFVFYFPELIQLSFELFVFFILMNGPLLERKLNFV